MDFYTYPDEAAQALFKYVMADPDNLPSDVKSTIVDLLMPGKSVSFAVSETAELIFARKSSLPNNVIKIGAAMANCAAMNRINNFADDDGRRGWGIANALRRHSGEKAPTGMSWPVKEDDPAPKQAFLPVEEPETPPPSPTPSE